MFPTLEMRFLLEVARKNGGTSGDNTALDTAIANYIALRNAEYNILQIHFEKIFCATAADLNAHVNAIVWMELGVENYGLGRPNVLNKQFMFEDKGVVKAVTPLVRQILVDR